MYTIASEKCRRMLLPAAVTTFRPCRGHDLMRICYYAFPLSLHLWLVRTSQTVTTVEPSSRRTRVIFRVVIAIICFIRIRISILTTPRKRFELALTREICSRFSLRLSDQERILRRSVPEILERLETRNQKLGLLERLAPYARSWFIQCWIAANLAVVCIFTYCNRMLINRCWWQHHVDLEMEGGATS